MQDRQDAIDAQNSELAQQRTDDAPPWWMAAQGAEADHVEDVARRAAMESDQFERGNQAMDRVISKHEDVPNAMRRDGLGDVSFYWGAPGDPARNFAGGHGVSKIIAKRTAEGADGESVAKHMVDVIAHGDVGDEYGPTGAERLNITMGDATAVLSRYRYGNRETWLLTGWDEPAGGDRGNQSPAYAPNPSGMRDAVGADSGQDASTREAPPDAARNGNTGTGRTDMPAGDGGPLDGRRPEPARAPDRTADDDLESSEAAFNRRAPQLARRFRDGDFPAVRATEYRQAWTQGYRGDPLPREAIEDGFIDGAYRAGEVARQYDDGS